MGSPSRSVALAIGPKFTSVLSIFGCVAILSKVLRSPVRRSKPMHRIVLAMSASGMLSSVWYFASTWPIPAGTRSGYGDGAEDIFGAVGDQANRACSASGFFNQFAVSQPLYNGALAWYYYLTVSQGWNEGRIMKIEWAFHFVPLFYAAFTSIFGAAADLYRPVEWTCWINLGDVADDDRTSIQSHFQTIQWVFLFGVVWVCTAFVSAVFVVLYRDLRKLERQMEKYAHAVVVGGGRGTAGAAPDNEQHPGGGSSAGDADIADEEDAFVENKADGGRRSTIQRISVAFQEKVKSVRAPFKNTMRSVRASMESRRESTKKSRKVAWQGTLYVLAFYVTWLFPTINRVTELAAGTNYFAVQILDTMFVPLQGFLNFIIYFRPRVELYQKAHPDVGFWTALKEEVLRDAPQPHAQQNMQGAKQRLDELRAQTEN